MACFERTCDIRLSQMVRSYDQINHSFRCDEVKTWPEGMLRCQQDLLPVQLHTEYSLLQEKTNTTSIIFYLSLWNYFMRAAMLPSLDRSGYSHQIQ